MRKVIAAFNMTLDGTCDHRTGIVDEAVHLHYTTLLSNAGLILYGRITFQLMQFWQSILAKPSEEHAMNAFATAIDQIPKLVYTHTLKNTDWDSAIISNKALEDEVRELKQKSGKDILVGSKSLIIQLINLNLIDELQICIHPLIEGDWNIEPSMQLQ